MAAFDRESSDRWGPRGAYVRLSSGKKFYLEDPQPEDFDLGTIIFHMSRINRYTGASQFTVAQHSVVAAKMAKRFYPDQALLPARMLIHDMAEHAYGDVSSPLKSILPDYKRLQAMADAVVEKRFDLTFVDDPLVKEVDDRMWLTERLLVLPMLTKEDDYPGPLDEFPLDEDELEELFQPWPTEVVEHEFRLAIAEQLPWVK